MEIVVKLDDAAARQALARIVASGEDLSPLWRRLSADLERSTVRRFEREVAPDGVPWLPSKAAQGLAPRASGGIRPGLTLNDSGALKLGILAQWTHDSLSVGVEAGGGPGIYAAIHQFGGTPDMHPLPASLPARPYLGLSADDRALIEAETVDWLAMLVANPSGDQ
jgi:phage virion morphogenesis protein